MKIVGNRPIDPRVFKGRNVTGQILRKLRDEFVEGTPPSCSGSGEEEEEDKSGEEDEMECTD